MIDITRLHVHYVDMKGKSHTKKIKPSDKTSTLAIKQDIARFLTKIKHDTEYYYVVMEVAGADKPLYRTIVRKTFLEG